MTPRDLDNEPTMCQDESSRRHTQDLLRRIGDKWSLATVAQLLEGPRRFTELMRALPGISHRMLTQTVRSLERDGLVTRTAYAETPPRVEYRLTALGHSLVPPILELTRWSEQTRQVVEQNRASFDRTR